MQNDLRSAGSTPGIGFIQLLYLLAGSLLFTYTAFYTDSPDTVFYLTISQKYATGNWSGAVNNYWSPFISWLLVPFHWAGADPLQAFKMLQLCLGLFTLVAVNRLALLYLAGIRLRLTFILSLVPALLSYALLYQTPDLLFLLLLLLLLLQLNRVYAEPVPSAYMGFVTGLTGAGLYLAKSYGFPFFLVSYSLVAFAGYRKHRSAGLRRIKPFGYGLGVFLLISGAWMGCLYNKYGTISTGYAPVYNFNLLAPGIYEPGQSMLMHPVLQNGLMDVNSCEEASAWETPGISRQQRWSPFSSRENLLHYLKVIGCNWVSFYYFMIRRNTGILFFFSCLLFFMLFGRRMEENAFRVMLALGLLFVYAAGYSLVFFMPRYLWFCSFLMLLLLFYFSERVFIAFRFWRIPVVGILVLALLLTVKKPVKELMFKGDVEMTSTHLLQGIMHPFLTLEQSYRNSRALPALINRLKTLGPPGARIAGWPDQDPAHLSYTRSLVLCMYLNQSFYGEPEPDLPDGAIVKSLQDKGISYMYAWYEFPSKSFLEKVFHDPATGFTLYLVKP